MADAQSQQENESTQASRDIFAMDTYMNVTAYGVGANEAVRRAEEEIERLKIVRFIRSTRMEEESFRRIPLILWNGL